MVTIRIFWFNLIYPPDTQSHKTICNGRLLSGTYFDLGKNLAGLPETSVKESLLLVPEDKTMNFYLNKSGKSQVVQIKVSPRIINSRISRVLESKTCPGVDRP